MNISAKLPSLRGDLKISQLDSSLYELLDSNTGKTLRLDSTGYLIAEQFEVEGRTLDEVKKYLGSDYALDVTENELIDFLKKADRLNFLTSPLSQVEGFSKSLAASGEYYSPHRNLLDAGAFQELRDQIQRPFGWFRTLGPGTKYSLFMFVLVFFFPWKLRTTGYLRVIPSQQVTVRASVEGVVSETFVQEGENVKSGANLIRMGEKIFIRAPINGVVSSSELETLVGKKLLSGDPILVISDSGKLSVEIMIPERDVAEIRVSKKILFKVQAFPRQTYSAIIRRIAPVAANSLSSDPKQVIHQTYFRVYGEIIENSEELKPGMTGVGQIESDGFGGTGWGFLGGRYFKNLIQSIRIEYVL